MVNISKLIYMSLVIRSLSLLIPKPVIYYVNALKHVFIWYSWYLIHEIINSWMVVWEFKTICTTHIMYIMHLNPIIVTLRRRKCIQYIMLTMVHTVGYPFKFALNTFYTHRHTLRKPFYTLPLKRNRYVYSLNSEHYRTQRHFTFV